MRVGWNSVRAACYSRLKQLVQNSSLCTIIYENLTTLISAWLDFAIDSRSDLRSVFSVLNGEKFLKDVTRSWIFLLLVNTYSGFSVSPFSNKICFSGEEILAPRPKLQD